MCASRLIFSFPPKGKCPPLRSAELLWIPFQNDLHRNNGAHAAAKNHDHGYLAAVTIVRNISPGEGEKKSQVAKTPEVGPAMRATQLVLI